MICDMNYYLLCLIRGNACLSFQNYFFFLLSTKSNVIKKTTSHSGALEFTRGFCSSRDVCVVFCRSLFALSLSIYDFWLPISLIHDKLYIVYLLIQKKKQHKTKNKSNKTKTNKKNQKTTRLKDLFYLEVVTIIVW